MRVRPAQVAAPDSRRRDQIVHYAQQKFLFDKNLARQQQIKMLSHGPGQRILDRNDRRSHRTTLHSIKDLDRASASDDLAARYHAPGGFVTERAGLALDRNPHSLRRCLRLGPGLHHGAT